MLSFFYYCCCNFIASKKCNINKYCSNAKYIVNKNGWVLSENERIFRWFSNVHKIVYIYLYVIEFPVDWIKTHRCLKDYNTKYIYSYKEIEISKKKLFRSVTPCIWCCTHTAPRRTTKNTISAWLAKIVRERGIETNPRKSSVSKYLLRGLPHTYVETIFAHILTKYTKL